jgi:hypothetical protein
MGPRDAMLDAARNGESISPARGVEHAMRAHGSPHTHKFLTRSLAAVNIRNSSGVSDIGAGELGAGRGAGELGAGRGAGELGAGRGAGELGAGRGAGELGAGRGAGELGAGRGAVPVTARSAGTNHVLATPSRSAIGIRCHSPEYLPHGTPTTSVSPAISLAARTSTANRSGAPRSRHRIVNRIGLIQFE